MSNIITWMHIDKNATKPEDVDIVRGVALKDVDSFIIDTLAMNDEDEKSLLKEGFVKTSTFCKDDGTGITREYAEYVHKRRLIVLD